MKKENSKERIELENDIQAFDKTWKGKMDGMDVIRLLRKVHPSYRADHARKLKSIGEITEIEMKEFTRGQVSYFEMMNE